MTEKPGLMEASTPLPSETSLATLWLILVRLVGLCGINTEQFVQEIGINPATLRDANARIPFHFSTAAFSTALATVPDPAFGLLAAKCWHPSNLGVVGYAWLSSENLRTGLKRLERFSRILGPRVNFRCKAERDTVRFIYGMGHQNSPQEEVRADFTLSIIMDMCRVNAGTHLKPVEVNLMRATPEHQQPYRDFFGCDIHFGAKENSFVLDAYSADMPLPSANQDLSATFDTILTEQLATLKKLDLPSLCRTYILKQLTSGEPTEAALANSLGMSRRTLQRKLSDLGIHYKQLLDQTRYALAKRYLDDRKKTLTDITFLLGFSEQSAFTRAFRRWHGTTPTEYRISHTVT